MTALIALGMVGCGGASTTPVEHGGEPSAYEGPVTSEDLALGEAKYNALCQGCHDGSFGPALLGGAEPPAEIRRQVREGSSNMPSFAVGRLSDNELEAIVAYLSAPATTDGGAGTEGTAEPTDGAAVDAAE